MRARLTALVMAGALAVGACGTGIANEDAAGDGGLGSGIGVEGAWTVEVHDEDGTLARHAAFHNDLALEGQQQLAGLLSREAVAGPWAVLLINFDSQPCETSSGSEAICFITEPGFFDQTSTNRFETLTADSAGSNAAMVTLSGSATVQNTTEVDAVWTQLTTCDPTTAPESCDGATGSSGTQFTAVDVSTLDWDGDGTANDGPIPVTAGQTVQVTVELSFGTL